jgi:hypothetical protein
MNANDRKIGQPFDEAAETEPADVAADLASPRKFVPTTPLAKKLYAIREQAIREGMELRPSEEISDELHASRGR